MVPNGHDATLDRGEALAIKLLSPSYIPARFTFVRSTSLGAISAS
jgi:hypothetical protein